MARKKTRRVTILGTSPENPLPSNTAAIPYTAKSPVNVIIVNTNKIAKPKETSDGKGNTILAIEKSGKS